MNKHFFPPPGFPVFQAHAPTALSLTLIGIVYGLLVRLGLWFSSPALELEAFWPAAGFGFAVAWIFGKKVLPVILLAGVLASWGLSLSFELYFLSESGNVLAILLGCELIKEFKTSEPLFGSPRNVVLFVVAGAFGHGFISALANVLGIYLQGTPSLQALAPAWWICFLANTSGTLVIAPVCVESFRLGRTPVGKNQFLEAVFVFSALFLTCALIFGKFWSLPLLVHPELFLLMPILLCAVFRLESRLSFAALALAGGVASLATSLGQDLSDPSVVKSLLLVEVNLMVLSLTILILTPLVTQRGKSLSDLK